MNRNQIQVIINSNSGHGLSTIEQYEIENTTPFIHLMAEIIFLANFYRQMPTALS